MIWLSGSSHCESTRKEVYPCLDRPVHHPLVDGSDKYERDKVSFVRARNVSCECGAKTCDSLPRQCGCWYSAEQGRVEFDSGKKDLRKKRRSWTSQCGLKDLAKMLSGYCVPIGIYWYGQYNRTASSLNWTWAFWKMAICCPQERGTICK